MRWYTARRGNTARRAWGVRDVRAPQLRDRALTLRWPCIGPPPAPLISVRCLAVSRRGRERCIMWSASDHCNQSVRCKSTSGSSRTPAIPRTIGLLKTRVWQPCRGHWAVELRRTILWALATTVRSSKNQHPVEDRGVSIAATGAVGAVDNVALQGPLKWHGATKGVTVSTDASLGTR